MYEFQDRGVASLDGYRDNTIIQNEMKGKNQRQPDIRKFIVSIKNKKESISTLKKYSKIIELKKETNELSIHFGMESQILGNRNATFKNKLIRAFEFQGDNPVQRERNLFNKRKWKRNHDQKNRIARMQANRLHLEFQNNQIQAPIPQVPTYADDTYAHNRDIYQGDEYLYQEDEYLYQEDEYLFQPYTESCVLYQTQPQLQFSEYNLNGSCNQFNGSI